MRVLRIALPMALAPSHWLPGLRDSGSARRPLRGHWRPKFHVVLMEACLDGEAVRCRGHDGPQASCSRPSDRRSAVQRIVCAAGGLEGFFNPADMHWSARRGICANAPQATVAQDCDGYTVDNKPSDLVVKMHTADLHVTVWRQTTAKQLAAADLEATDASCRRPAHRRSGTKSMDDFRDADGRPGHALPRRSCSPDRPMLTPARIR